MMNGLSFTSNQTNEPNVLLINATVTADLLDRYLHEAFLKKRMHIEIDGYAKGAASRKVIEDTYGENFFLEDALNMLVPDAARDLIDNSGLEIIGFGESTVIQASNGKDLVFTLQAVVYPEVKLGEYLGLRCRKRAVALSNDELSAEIQKMLEAKSTRICVKRPVQNGDEIALNFKGFVDGIAFEGGEAENYTLVVGSHSFIPGFEEQLVGAKIDEPISINVVFPEDYHAENLKGKPAVFECLVTSIYESVLPELGRFAQSLGFDSIDSFKNDVKNELIYEKEKAAKEEVEQRIIEMVIANAEVHIPDILIEPEANQRIEDFKTKLANQGLDFDSYLKFTGQTADSVMNEARSSVEMQLRADFVMRAIAKAENLTTTEDDINKAIEDMSKRFDVSKDQVKLILGEEGLESLRHDVCKDKAVSLVINSAIIE